MISEDAKHLPLVRPPLPPGEGWGEGASHFKVALALRENFFENIVEKIVNVLVGKSNHPITFTLKNLRARRIVRLTMAVRRAINFSDQSHRVTIEVGDV